MSAEALKQEIQKAAREKAAQIIADAEQKAKAILEEANSKVKDITETKYRTMSKKLQQKERIYLAQTRVAERKKLIDIQGRYVDLVYSEAEERLKSLPKDNPKLYETVLSNFITEGVQSLGAPEVQIMANEADVEVVGRIIEVVEDRLKASGDPVKIRLSPERINNAGGVIIHAPSLHAYYVNTIESRLKQTESEARGKVLKTLLGEE